MKPTKESYPKAYLYNRIVKAKLFIDTYFFERIDLENISDMAFFSKYHFTRLFKAIYGKTPHQYLIRVRIEHAKRYLEAGEKPAKVCFDTGFESISSFTGLFKRITTQTPGGYRQAYNNRRKKIKESPLYFIPNCFMEPKDV